MTIYTALLTQFGVSAPVPVVLVNTIGKIEFTYEEPGTYLIQSHNAFIDKKTSIIIGNEKRDGPGINAIYSVQRVDDSNYYLFTKDTRQGGTENDLHNQILGDTTITINIYP